jgi:tetratricopeptide (TPR) repeat protein
MDSRELADVFRSGRIQEAEAYEQIVFYEQLAIPTALEQGQSDSVAAFSINVGMAYFHERRFQEALGRLTYGLKLFESAGDILHTAETLDNLGIVSARMGNFAQARHYYLRALDISVRAEFQQLPDTICHNLMQMVYRERDMIHETSDGDRGTLEPAEEHPLSHPAIEAGRIIGRVASGQHPHALAPPGWPLFGEPFMEQLNRIAIYYLGTNQSLAAVRTFEHMLGYAESTNNITAVEDLLFSIGDAYLGKELWKDASAFFREALERYRSTGRRGMEGWTERYLAICHREMGLHDPAAVYVGMSMKIASEDGQALSELEARATLATILFAAGRAEQAHAELAQCLSKLGSGPLPPLYDHWRSADPDQLLRNLADEWSLPISQKISEHLRDRSFPTRANDSHQVAETRRMSATRLEQALAGFQASGPREMEMEANRSLAITYRDLGILDTAAAYAWRSAAISSSDGEAAWEIRARATLAAIFFADERRQQAYVELSRCLSLLDSASAPQAEDSQQPSAPDQILRTLADAWSAPMPAALRWGWDTDGGDES